MPRRHSALLTVSSWHNISKRLFVQKDTAESHFEKLTILCHKDMMMVTSTITSGEKLLAIFMCVRSDDALSHLLIVGWGKTMGM